MKIKLLVLILLVYCIKLFSYFTTEYALVDSLSEEWQQAGIISDLPIPSSNPDYIRYIDSSMNADLINSKIQELVAAGIGPNNIGLLEFAPGEYDLNVTLELESYIILRGNHMFERDENRDERTVLNFNFTSANHNEENCIEVIGVSNIQMTTTVGIEDIWIKRVDEGNHSEENDEGNNISFEYAENCWVYGVESEKPIKNHLRIAESNNIEIFGCYFNDAQFHGEGGFGYGVFISDISTHCLVENNIFRKCRHAMMVNNAAHYNVFGYNYVTKSKQKTIDNLNFSGWPSLVEDFVRWLLNTCIPDDFISDLSCHGESSYEHNMPSGYRGPFSNLFEGNICNAIWVDSFHGQNRKFNTFFRNRSKKYGMSIFDELPDFSALGSYYSTRQTKQITINNYLKSVMHWTDTWELQLTGYTVSYIANAILPPTGLYGLYLTFAFLEEYADLTRGRWFDKKPFEKNTIVKRKNFWGQYYTRTWTDNHYAEDEDAWNDISYYLDTMPTYWPNSNPYHPKNQDHIPSSRRYSAFIKNTVSRYDNPNSAVTNYVTEDVIYTTSQVVDNDECLVFDSSDSINGITISFAQDVGITVHGSIIVNGTEDKPVLFKSVYDEPNLEEKWNGIYFGSASNHLGNSELNYCYISNAKYTTSFGFEGGGVKIFVFEGEDNTQTEIVFNNCSFINCSGSYGGAVSIHNTVDYGITENSQLNVDFNNCYFSSNNGMVGGAVYAYRNSPKFVNCKFYHNTTYNNVTQETGVGGAVAYRSDDPFREPILVDNVFFDNDSYQVGALWFWGRVNNSGFTENDIYLINNSFINNYSEDIAGNICFTGTSGTVYVQNNIMWGNWSDYDAGNHNYVYHGGGNQIVIELCNETLNNHQFEFVHNDIEGGVENVNNHTIDCIIAYNLDANEQPVDINATYTNNLNDDPLFSSGIIISSNSPCFNSGDELDEFIDLGIPSLDNIGNTRFSSTSYDIGAVEVYDLGIHVEDPIINLNNVNPDNPINTSLRISNLSSNQSISNISCEVSGMISDYIEVIDCPIAISPDSYEFVKLEFAPTKMYLNYEGNLLIHSNDLFFPELSIPITSFTGFQGGWNWVSFPYGSLQNEQVFDVIDPFGLSIVTDIGFMSYDSVNNDWIEYGLTSIENNKCHKIKMNYIPNSYDIECFGSHENTSVTLYPEQDNWVGYWRLESQNIDDAFGDDFDKVISVSSEEWYYGEYPINPDRESSEPENPSSIMRSLHFGRGYVVRVSELIEDFNWNYSGGVFDTESIGEPDFFTFEEEAEYNVIDITDIDESIIEIGAIVDSTCIGAAVVKDSMAQILIYNNGNTREDMKVNFEYVSTLRERHLVSNYYVFNFNSNEFEENCIYLNDDNYNLVSFSFEENNISESITLNNNYPNPFNPETNISFSIPKDSKVNITVYNIKGQKVATLLDNEMEKGIHEVSWRSKDSSGKAVASGVYFYKLQVDGKMQGVKKMLLLK